MEEVNKYWIKKDDKICRFCKDCLEHYVEECKEIKDWFVKLGKNKKRKVRENL